MKHLVLVGLVSSIAVVQYVLWRVPRHSALSLSQHIAKDALAIAAARIMISLVAAMVAMWYFGWYVTTHDTFMLQAGLLVWVCVSAVLMALVPHHEGRTAGVLHIVFACTYASTVLPLVVTFALTSENVVAQLMIGLCAAWQLYSATLYLFYPPARKHFFQYELSFIGAFAATLFVSTYIG